MSIFGMAARVVCRLVVSLVTVGVRSVRFRVSVQLIVVLRFRIVVHDPLYDLQ